MSSHQCLLKINGYKDIQFIGNVRHEQLKTGPIFNDKVSKA